MKLSNNSDSNVLFVHDGPMYEDDKGRVYGIHFKEDIKARYLQLGDSVTFCMRSQKIADWDMEKYSLIMEDDFNFVKFPNFKSIRTYFINRPLAKRIIENQVRLHDILIARLPSAAGTIAVKAARKYEKPYLVEFVACTFDTYWQYNWQGKLIAYYKFKEQQHLIKDCPYVIYVTKDYLQGKYPTRGKAINCSNVELSFTDEEVLVKRLHKIAIQSDCYKFATIGGLDIPYKGQIDVLKALAKLKRSGSTKFRYYLVGQGSPNNIKRMATQLELDEQVEIVGALPHDEVFKFIDDIDVLIHSSRTEGLPRVVIEAMSRACPVIAASAGGVPELLKPEALYKPGDSVALCEKLEKLDKKWLVKQAKRNFQESQGYTKTVLDEKRFEFFKKFLAANCHE